LRPNSRRLKELSERVTGSLIPELRATGARFAAEDIQQHDDHHLAAAIRERLESLREWKKTYREDFIPFAHGVRQLAQYYNDLVRPSDPYEFVALLRSNDMLASRRNLAMARLAGKVRGNGPLRDAIAAASEQVSKSRVPSALDWREHVRTSPGGAGFLEEFDALVTEHMDITYGSERLLDRPDLVLHTLSELAAAPREGLDPGEDRGGEDPGELERRFLEIAGPSRRDEAAEILGTGRISWQLRDDDNLLLSRIESQLRRAVDEAVKRLHAAGRVECNPPRVTDDMVPVIAAALEDSSNETLVLPDVEERDSSVREPSQEKPRQLIGQPASPGLATGEVRRVVEADDIRRFCAGEVLVCDAIQPMMTHLVPLAAAIVERRGGMLIHGAIIAREMHIPCVNGIAHAASVLEDGQVVTVDGHLGIVTIGLPEFDVELR
jgi:pyruvate,water dikinase